MRRAALAFCLLLACDDDDGVVRDAGAMNDASTALDAGEHDARPSEAPFCVEADLLYYELLSSDPVLDTLRACSRDRDCTTWQPELKCAGKAFSKLSCPRGITNESAELAQDQLREVTSELCERVAPTCSAGDVPCSAPRGVRCVAQRCTTFELEDGGGLRRF